MKRLVLFLLLSACVSAQAMEVSVTPTVLEFEDALPGTLIKASVIADWDSGIATEVTVEFAEGSWMDTSPSTFILEPGTHRKELLFTVSIPHETSEKVRKEKVLLKTKSLTSGIGTEVVIPVEVWIKIGSELVLDMKLSSLSAGYDGQEITGEYIIENKGNSHGESAPSLQLLGRSMEHIILEIPTVAEGVGAFTRKTVSFSFPVQLQPGEYFIKASIGDTNKIKLINVPEPKKRFFSALPAGAAFLILTAFLLWRRS